MKINIKIFLCFIMLLFIGFGSGFCYRYITEKQNTDNNLKNNIISNSKNDATDNNDINTNDNDNTNSDLNISNNCDYVIPKLDTRFTLSKVITKINPSYNTPWKTNSENNLKICIDGKGPNGTDEGNGVIYIKNKYKMYKISLENNSDFAPSYVEWLDENSFLVLITGKYSSKDNETLYKVDIDELKPYIIYNAKENEDILEAEKTSYDIIDIKIYKEGSLNAETVEKIIKLQ